MKKLTIALLAATLAIPAHAASFGGVRGGFSAPRVGVPSVPRVAPMPRVSPTPRVTPTTPKTTAPAARRPATTPIPAPRPGTPAAAPVTRDSGASWWTWLPLWWLIMSDSASADDSEKSAEDQKR